MPTSCKKTHDFIALRVFSNIDAASLPQNVYYCVIAVHEGGHTPETRAASSDMPQHHPMYEGPVRCFGGIATPQGPRPA